MTVVINSIAAPCSPCKSLHRDCGWHCAEFDTWLSTGPDGAAVRCYDCIETNNPNNPNNHKNSTEGTAP